MIPYGAFVLLSVCHAVALGLLGVVAYFSYRLRGMR